MRAFKEAVLSAAIVLGASGAHAQDISDAGLLIWGVKAERLEYRYGDEGEKIAAIEGDAFIGTDEFKLFYEGEGEYDLDEEAFETLENQVTGLIPISPFFDAKAGVRFENPEGPDRVYGVVGLHGLAPQWFEVDMDMFLSQEGDVSGRFEAEYEGLITNQIILTPSIEVDFGFSHDREIGLGSGLRSVEVGARLSYDLIDRAVAPYIGVHYEHLFGGTRALASSEGEDTEAVFAVAGIRIMF